MKKILLSTMISTIGLSSIAQAEISFRYQIPEPNFVSNDWDNDGQPNNVDPDDDNDGVNDTEDSTPFGRGGQNSSNPAVLNSFSAVETEVTIGDDVILNWNVDHATTLTLYDDNLLTNQIAEVTGLTTYTYSNIQESKTFYLDYGTGVGNVAVTANEPVAVGADLTFSYKPVDTRVYFFWGIDERGTSHGSGSIQINTPEFNYDVYSINIYNNGDVITVVIDEATSAKLTNMRKLKVINIDGTDYALGKNSDNIYLGRVYITYYIDPNNPISQDRSNPTSPHNVSFRIN